MRNVKINPESWGFTEGCVRVCQTHHIKRDRRHRNDDLEREGWKTREHQTKCFRKKTKKNKLWETALKQKLVGLIRVDRKANGQNPNHNCSQNICLSLYSTSPLRHLGYRMSNSILYILRTNVICVSYGPFRQTHFRDRRNAQKKVITLFSDLRLYFRNIYVHMSLCVRTESFCSQVYIRKVFGSNPGPGINKTVSYLFMIDLIAQSVTPTLQL